MKKHLVLTAMAFATTGALAQASNFEGFSAAVNLNTVSVNTKLSSSDSALLADGIGKQSWNGSLQGAYGFALSPNAVLSVGLNYGLGSSKAGSLSFSYDDGTGTTENLNTALKLKNQWSLYVEPGFLVSDKTMLYGKLGYESAKGTFTSDGELLESKTIRGSSFGFGMRTTLSKNTFIQAEVKQVGYKNKAFDDSTISFKTKATVGTIGFGMKF